MKRLVLLGGGHSHAFVLDALARRPPLDTQVTLVTPHSRQVYSGMLPGWLAGHYHLQDCLLPLDTLAQRAGIAFRRATAIGLDPAQQFVICSDGDIVGYDLLSIDTGSATDLRGMSGAAQHALPVRPTERFIHGCRNLVEQAKIRPRTVITVIGGGAAGIELTLALRRRLGRLMREGRVVFQLISASEVLLPQLAPSVGRWLQARLAARGVCIYARQSVAAFLPDGIVLHTGERLDSDFNLIATGASAPAWLARSGLATDERGFVCVNPFLQSTSHENVFAAGDIATIIGQPRPKSGVYAVRAGPPLTENLRRALGGEALRRHRPPRRALCLIGTGGHHAIASWGPFAWQGRWVWRWKDRIDRRFMARFVQPATPTGPPLAKGEQA
jgi:pyridine nucleotide-disulfide oxidoreductase family protein